MQEIEFVKLKHWLDAEITMIHIYLAIIIGLLAHNTVMWIVVGVYSVGSFLYVVSRLAYVEAKERGYLKLYK